MRFSWHRMLLKPMPDDAGAAGFGAFSAHVPQDGNVVILMGPHVAIGPDGEVGKVARVGQTGGEPSSYTWETSVPLTSFPDLSLISSCGHRRHIFRMWSCYWGVQELRCVERKAKCERFANGIYRKVFGTLHGENQGIVSSMTRSFVGLVEVM